MDAPPRLVALRAYVTVTGHAVELRVPTWHWAWRGLALALALPPLLAGLAVMASLDEEGVAAPSVIFAGLGGMAFAAGILLALVSPLLSARTRTRLDFARGVVTTARSPHPVPLGSLSGLRLAPAARWSSFSRLTALRAGAPELALLGPLTLGHAREAAMLAGWLSARLALPLEDSISATAGGTASSGKDELAGLLCYLPIQGVFVLASLYYLFAARDRPFVRFCAIQSLSQLVFSIVVLVVILLGLGLPVGLTEPSPLQTALVVLLAVALSGFWLWNFGAHAYACYSAYKGRLWVMPWLGFVVRRFRP